MCWALQSGDVCSCVRRFPPLCHFFSFRISNNESLTPSIHPACLRLYLSFFLLAVCPEDVCDFISQAWFLSLPISLCSPCPVAWHQSATVFSKPSNSLFPFYHSTWLSFTENFSQISLGMMLLRIIVVTLLLFLDSFMISGPHLLGQVGSVYVLGPPSWSCHCLSANPSWSKLPRIKVIQK